MNATPVPPRSLNAALAHVEAGGMLVVATRLRVTVIDRRAVRRFAKADAWLLKEEGDGYRLRDGRGSVYLFAGQLLATGPGHEKLAGEEAL